LPHREADGEVSDFEEGLGDGRNLHEQANTRSSTKWRRM
jgi:hypothetical protein